MGVSDTKTNSVSKAFEIITLKSLKDKYSFIKDIVYCNDGKTKITCFNATGQPNFDFVVKISDRDNNEPFIAFDHKVKDYESCIKDIEKNGFKYSVFTLGDIQDQTFYENPGVKQQLSNYSRNMLLEQESLINVYRKEIPFLKQTLDNIYEFEKTGNKEILLKSPLMPVLLINFQDIQKKILELQARVNFL